MNCNDTSKLLDAYVDQELFLKDGLEIEKHLRNCLTCKEKYDNMRSLQSTLGLVKKHSPDTGLQNRIQHSLSNPSRPSVSTKTSTPGFQFFKKDWFRYGAPSFAMGIVLTVGAVGFFSGENNNRYGNDHDSANSNYLTEIKSSHVRSLMASHLIDVSSADKHKLKPWLNTVLDFSPPIEDLETDGFNLLGARLEYVQNGQAAALVYKIRNHYINLMIWPARNNTQFNAVTSPDQSQNQSQSQSQNQKNSKTTIAETFQGYALIHWRHSGLNYSAISDLNKDELNTFVSKYRDKTKSL